MSSSVHDGDDNTRSVETTGILLTDADASEPSLTAPAEAPITNDQASLQICTDWDNNFIDVFGDAGFCSLPLECHTSTSSRGATREFDTASEVLRNSEQAAQSRSRFDFFQPREQSSDLDFRMLAQQPSYSMAPATTMVGGVDQYPAHPIATDDQTKKIHRQSDPANTRICKAQRCSSSRITLPPPNGGPHFTWSHGMFPSFNALSDPTSQHEGSTSQIPAQSSFLYGHENVGRSDDNHESSSWMLSERDPGSATINTDYETVSTPMPDAYCSRKRLKTGEVKSSGPLQTLNCKENLYKVVRTPLNVLNTPVFKDIPSHPFNIARDRRMFPASDQGRVSALIDAMNDMSEAQDNTAMKQSWTKLKSTKADKIRTTCEESWRALQRAWYQNGTPLGDKPVHHEYQTVDDRFYALCEVLKQQKTICKHMIADPYISQVVDDPIQAGKRVVNNRKVNDQKKEVIKRGREKEGTVGQGKGRPLKRINATPSLQDEETAGNLELSTFLDTDRLNARPTTRISSSKLSLHSNTRQTRQQAARAKCARNDDNDHKEHEDRMSPQPKEIKRSAHSRQPTSLGHPSLTAGKCGRAVVKKNSGDSYIEDVVQGAPSGLPYAGQHYFGHFSTIGMPSSSSTFPLIPTSQYNMANPFSQQEVYAAPGYSVSHQLQSPNFYQRNVSSSYQQSKHQAPDPENGHVDENFQTSLQPPSP